MEDDKIKSQNTVQQKSSNEQVKNKKSNVSKLRIIIVFFFVLIFATVSYVQLRGSYLQYEEIGEKYINIFNTNLTYRYTIMAINFIVVYIIIYFTNRGIKKGLKPFFKKEQKEMPKLLNKSLALVISMILSVVVSAVTMQKLMLAINATSFGIQDTIFGLDISYFMFQKPVIEMLVFYFTTFMIGLTLYIALYYVIVFNRYFDGIDGKMLKQSIFMKKIYRNLILIVLGIAVLTVFNIQNIEFGKILSINNEIDLVGAGMTERTVKLFGYIIFAFVIIIFAYRALKNFKNGKTNKVLKNLVVIPSYLVFMFIIMVLFDTIYVNTNELDKERNNIAENIKNTKNAYQLNIEETNLTNSGTITEEEVDKYQHIIDNVPIITKDVVLKTLQDTQTGTGHYSYRNANIAKYKIGEEERVVYLAPREIKNSGRTYNNKTYEYTHGMGEIIASATTSTQAGNIEYIQKDVSGKDEQIKISKSEIYFGLETNEIIATNTKSIKEYDYTDESGNEKTSTYTGKAGLKVGFLDRIILGLTSGNINLAFSSEFTNESKVLLNRNVVDRAKKLLPYLIYDESPYTVVTDDGNIVWVIDAYTVSGNYPYSQYTTIEHNGVRENINYIRNSVKVLVDSYDGTIDFYITDRTDPIAMAYRNIYPELFMDLDEEIPQDIQEHLVYPQYLYKVQQEILKAYHNVKTDVLYRGDDLWDIAKYNSVRSTRASGNYMEPYYTMVKTLDGEKLGLIQIYTPNEKQNIISYLVGSTEGTENKLQLYKFSADSNIVGLMQLDKQIEEDEIISAELEALNTTGTKISKNMIVVPIDNTLLYVEPIYQTMLNESEIPILKKIVVASGNKVAIGDTLVAALENLLSQYAVDIEVEDTDDIEGLIEAIIKANKNLIESNENNDWELMGQDIKKLQELIQSLEILKEEEDKKNAELKDQEKNNNETIENKNENVNVNTNTTNNNIHSYNDVIENITNTQN